MKKQYTIAVLSFSLILLFHSTTLADTQISPNPNPVDNTITVTNTNDNSEWFVNYGVIQVATTGFLDFGGHMENSGTINNFGKFEGYGSIENTGTLDNGGTFAVGDIFNSGYINNNSTGTFTNSTTLYNNKSITNLGIFNNNGGIDGTGNITNEGTINGSGVLYGNVLNNSGIIEISGGISFDYINNSKVLKSLSDIENGGKIDNSGTIEIATLWNESDEEVDNSGTFKINGSYNYGTILNRSSGTFENSGSFRNMALNSELYNEGLFINETGSNIINGYTPPGGTPPGNIASIINTGTLINNGTFYNQIDGVFQNEGTYQGTGTFVGDLDSGIGTIAPGNSAGTMKVEGNFFLSTDGTLEIEIGGFDGGEYDFIDITGTATLADGQISFLFLSGYDISTDVLPGQTKYLKFLEADNGINSFASAVTYDFLGTPPGFVYDVYQDGTVLWFSAENTNAVPVPGALLLGSIGIGCVARLRRRKAI